MIELIELNSSISPNDLLTDYPKKTKMTGFFKIGFIVSGFDAWVNFLNQSKVEFHGKVVTDKTSNKRTVIVKDPDGNRIQIFEK